MRKIYPPLSKQHAYLHPDSMPTRGAGYDKRGVMRPGHIDTLYEDVRASLKPYELNLKH